MSRRFVDKVALLMSTESPLMDEVRQKTGTSGTRDPLNRFYGFSDTSLKKWLKQNTTEKIPEGVSRLCETAAANRKSYGITCGQELTTDDFDDGVDCFRFSEKLGYQPSEWFVVQQHMNSVQFKYHALGREHSCLPKDAGTIADRFIGDRYTGAAFLYFMSYTINSHTPVLQRATLRVQREVRLDGSHAYVPCKVKMLIPSFSRTPELRTYIGKVTMRRNRLFFSLGDDSRDRDFIEFFINVGDGFGRRRWNGVYTSITGHVETPMEYSSGIHLQRMEVGKLGEAQPTLDFMNTRAWTGNNVNELPDEHEDAEFKNYLQGFLHNSPWSPVDGSA